MACERGAQRVTVRLVREGRVGRVEGEVAAGDEDVGAPLASEHVVQVPEHPMPSGQDHPAPSD